MDVVRRLQRCQHQLRAPDHRMASRGGISGHLCTRTTMNWWSLAAAHGWPARQALRAPPGIMHCTKTSFGF